MKSIAILTCWYGPYPWYFSYFLTSCSNNPTIDYFIITDNTREIVDKPENVRIIRESLEQVRGRASSRLGFEVSIDYAYKLCDLKPVYGYLFSEVIEGYDFWGAGDIDVVYGQLRNFLTTRLLDCHDVFSFRPEYLSGCLTIYRNTKAINELFIESRDYKRVLSDQEYFNFDECNFKFVPLWVGAPIEDVPFDIESMTHVVIKKMKEGYLRAYFDFNLIEGNVGNLKWKEGKIIYKNQFECILYHLLKFKQCYTLGYKPPCPKDGDIICFSENKIYKRDIALEKK